ncbi:MAG: AsmA-like C-terminal region-containing protein [Acidobacteriota bacterium]|nr:AsmA-like C-terminal region-containing protein [Acidobacteriota bacterium]
MRPLARRLLIGGLAVAVIAGISMVVVVRNWPFTQAALTKVLEDRFARKVEIHGFRSTYFPPGCEADQVEFLHRFHKDRPPLITVRRLIIKASYAGLFSPHKRIAEVQVIGLHVLVPPKSTAGGAHSIMPLTDLSSNPLVAISMVKADGAVLEFLSKNPGREPFRLEIQQLTVTHVGEKGPISFQATLQNTEPPGEIQSTGQFGPWNAEDPGNTPVAGRYVFQHADLGVYGGIAGTLTSKGKFSGLVDHIESEGDADVPNFHLSGTAHAVHVSTTFRAAVDATNGDTSLENVRSQFLRTTILSSGGVTGGPNQHGKTADLQLIVDDGHIDDLLRLFAEQDHPSMTGAVRLHARFNLPPGSPGFLRRLKLEGDFGIGGGRLTNALAQVPINRLSESARGESRKQETADPQTVLSNLKGHVSVKNGIATLSNVSFTAPGTLAQIRGTYSLIDHSMNLQGILHTNGKLSDTTSGFKAFVLKGISPFLKRKSTTVVPFTITGTSSHPAFALDFDGKRSF